MNRKALLVIAAGAVAAVGGIIYMSHMASAPKVEQTQGAIVIKKPVTATICVQPVANNSKKPLDMDGVSEALVKELKAAGMDAGMTSAQGGGCDATIHTEIVEVGGRERKNATVEFRVASKYEAVPLLSASVKGTGEPSRTGAVAAVYANSFAPSQAKAKNRDAAERSALVAAFGEQAHRIAGIREKLASK